MTTPTKRRRFRFSLRTLLIVVVLLSLPLGWFALKMREAARQRKAMEAIREAGGDVFYDYQLTGDLFFEENAEPHAPAWLRKLGGDGIFADIVCVHFSYREDVGDVVWEDLKGLTKLESLTLSGTQVSDAGLRNLKGLTRLEYLGLANTHVTDAGLENLKGLTILRQLDLSGTQVTDDGLLHLRGLADF